MKEDEWNDSVQYGKSFRITVLINGEPDKPTGASIDEQRVLYYRDGSYYRVLNGPMDLDWLDTMYSKE
ncbi:hypothetical protein JNUCC1_01786 [Lentibacillus sp. JNUCC-1]|uniref:hypothetical protein n=1 Tax=Lentibacillus sp. JNUCC-1 TaxID=2654513 RepID=UPI001321C7FC|nr:hypothetical protein [Lentibacillus sp. JNUCC-1]MUV37978.1 hypothetical protein [Lentibacillus sp. JNUCC-1]